MKIFLFLEVSLSYEVVSIFKSTLSNKGVSIFSSILSTNDGDSIFRSTFLHIWGCVYF